MIIRPESPADLDAIHAINSEAFPTDAEARLVDSLRQLASPVISLVAEQASTVVGHILFSPVSLSGHADMNLMGLAPMAVAPAQQSSGVGSALVKAGLSACRKLGVEAVVVLGHPQYYPRFGFRPSVEFGVDSDYDVAAEVFMLQELISGCLSEKGGRVTYHAAFSAL